ncbi:hypothetical protein BJX99DRAFT_229581 [Aspergillus californicus]
MAFLLNLFFQKRLLKYALSRLEFFDTEDLDLDRLGICWGSRSTVELRDVGLRLEKIAQLLHLPPSSELLSARIRLLKLTVPADIHSSGIICEGSGIDVHLRLPSEEEATAVKENIYAGHDFSHETIIPTSADLAKSFLQTEPKEEKEELQAAITTRSQVLHRTSSSISDDEEELGLGNETVSLPGFLAAILNGIVDRLQVHVDDISIRLDVETKQEGSSKRQPEGKPDLITGLLSIRQINVGAVATEPTRDGHCLHIGKRPVAFSGINLALVSEPIVFSNYSRFAVPASPSTAVPSKPSQPPSPASSIPHAPSSISSSTHAMMQSTIFKPSHDTADADPEMHNTSLERSGYTYDGRFSDADTEETRSSGYLEKSQNFLDDDKLLDNPSYLDSVIDSQLQDDDFEDQDDSPNFFDNAGTDESTPRLHTPLLQTLPPDDTRQGFNDRPNVAVSQPNIRDVYETQLSRGGILSRDDEHAAFSSMPNLSSRQNYGIADNAAETSQSIPVSPASSIGSDRASAQSMYMSAISHDAGGRSFMPTMPGAWDSHESTASHGTVHHESSGHPDESTILGRYEEGETTVSTPTPTDHEEEYDLGRVAYGGSDTLHSEPTDTQSSRSASSFHGVTDVAKTFLHIDRVTIFIPPTKHAETQDILASVHSGTGSDDFENSTMHLAASETSSTSQTRLGSTNLAFAAESAERKSDNKQGPGSDGHLDALSIEISSVQIQFDIAIGWLITKFGQRILQTFGGGESTGVERGGPKDEAQDPQALNLTLGKLAVKFVEHVPENPHPLGTQEAHFTTYLNSLHDAIILQTTAAGLKAHFSKNKGTTKFRANLSKFTLGCASDDFISFSEDLRMRESTRDISSLDHGDISLSFRKSPEEARLVIDTLPLHVNLNIQQLEEIIGWFGGLSMIIELGNSIPSVSGNKGPKRDVPKRARGVRFEGSLPPPPLSSTDAVPLKVDARIGGIAVDVIGESHYLRLRTTAAKIVSRVGGVRLQIDKAELSGPLPLDDSTDAPAIVNLGNMRTEFLFATKEHDLEQLLALITPSKDKYDEDDDIMFDTLCRQRKQGSVLRVTVSNARVVVSEISGLGPLQQLGEELGRLSNVTKYLPEDDRPGILTLMMILNMEICLHVGGQVGIITANFENAEAAHISIPSLVAAQLGSISVVRNEDEELIGNALPSNAEQPPLPALMIRFIADEMDPTFKIKLHNLRAEYTVSSITAFLGIGDEMTSGEVAANMASSLANLTELQPPFEVQSPRKRSSTPEKPTKLTVDMRDCVIGLNPRGTVAKGLVVLTNAGFCGAIHDPSSSEATLDLRKASLLVIDDVNNIELGSPPSRRSAALQSAQIHSFMDMGYVSISTISSATATVKIVRLSDDGTKSLDVELRDDLLILETCADSTQTLISIMNGLQPPTPPSVATKYRTEVMPINDMLASFSGNEFAADWPDDSPEGSFVKPDFNDDDYVSVVDPIAAESQHRPDDSLAEPGSNNLLDSFHSQYYASSSLSELDFRDDHFAQQSSVGGTAHRWDSTQNTYGLSDDSKIQKSPLRLRVRDAHVIWNLFDGYDWQRTRDTISKAVKDVEKKATGRRIRPGSRSSPGQEEEEEAIIGDCLFNSIYIDIPANRDPGELRGDINRHIDDFISETGSYATNSTVTTVRRNQSPSLRGRKLRLSRSKSHKMTFELKGICADFVVFPPDSGETQNSLDVRVKELEIFDHVPTSTWKKFATYMREAGEKESGSGMLHLEILTVRPVAELAASEIVLKATVLPLRLHVDQDALDFLSRFFEFRDDSAPAAGPPQDVPFLQRVEINAIQVKLDFKPKRVDYASLRSGRTTEFMNFFVLDEADMVMRHLIIYGVSGFDKLGQMLNDIWMPDIKRNQLPGVISGLAPLRSLVNVGSGVRDLVVVPMREYRKDGRIVRSIQKGAVAFAKNTSNELVKLGAKLAIGTQTVLQGAEELLNTPGGQQMGDEEDETDDEAAKKISLYADQPIGVVQGLQGAFRGLERDLLLTRDAIIAVPGEVAESGSATAAAKAVFKRAPTLILRPAIGVSKAVGQTLLGAGNSLDPSNRRKMEDKYKRH